MYKLNSVFKGSYNVCGICKSWPMYAGYQRYRSKTTEAAWKPKRVVILSKTSRYQFEKQRFPDFSENQLQALLEKRGSNYTGLVTLHKRHADSLVNLAKTLASRNIEVRILQRKDYSPEAIKWADTIISAGGDGTYIKAASKVLDRKPIIGINTDPLSSEGHLCLPNKYTLNFGEALDKLAEGKFRWTLRQRIRVTLEGGYGNENPIDVHQLDYWEHHQRHSDHDKDSHMNHSQAPTHQPRTPKVLPVRALNEVFVGESLSSKSSYYELSINGGPREKQKSSGIIISTGSGSTSWSFNVNKLTPNLIKDVIRRVGEETGRTLPCDDSTVNKVTQKFNQSLVFDPEARKMFYSVRDPVVNGIFSAGSSRGHADRITICSRMWDACLVLDSGSSIVFNDGAVAHLEIIQEDALRTLQLLETD